MQCHAVCRSLFRFVCSVAEENGEEEGGKKEEEDAFIESVYSEKGDDRTMAEKCTVGRGGGDVDSGEAFPLGAGVGFKSSHRLRDAKGAGRATSGPRPTAARGELFYFPLCGS